MSEQINHPSHYNAGKVEVIEFIEDQKFGYHLGNAIKYLCRAGKKLPEKYNEELKWQLTNQDLEKAIWYIRRHQETLLPEQTRRRPNEMDAGWTRSDKMESIK